MFVLIVAGCIRCQRVDSQSVVLDQVLTAATAFSATNLDDIVILILLLSRSDHGPTTGQVMVGQVLGLALLVAVSLLGFCGRVLVPKAWLGLLGLMPISLGISQLMAWIEGPEPDQQALHLPPGAGIVGVTALTIANGSDNLGVYLPLFAHASPSALVITLVVFALGVALWCWIAWRLTRLPAVAPLLSRFGGPLVPCVLIGLGVLILVDSHLLVHRVQAGIALVVLLLLVRALARQLQPPPANPPLFLPLVPSAPRR